MRDARRCHYGLDAAGEPGLDRALDLLHAETSRALPLVGSTRVDQLHIDGPPPLALEVAALPGPPHLRSARPQ